MKPGYATRAYIVGEGSVDFHEGNFDSDEEYKKKRLGVDADKPHRIKYRKLSKT